MKNRLKMKLLAKQNRELLEWVETLAHREFKTHEIAEIYMSTLKSDVGIKDG